jgi:hypothetical protein
LLNNFFQVGRTSLPRRAGRNRKTNKNVAAKEKVKDEEIVETETTVLVVPKTKKPPIAIESFK